MPVAAPYSDGEALPAAALPGRVGIIELQALVETLANKVQLSAI